MKLFLVFLEMWKKSKKLILIVRDKQSYELKVGDQIVNLKARVNT